MVYRRRGDGSWSRRSPLWSAGERCAEIEQYGAARLVSAADGEQSWECIIPGGALIPGAICLRWNMNLCCGSS